MGLKRPAKRTLNPAKRANDRDQYMKDTFTNGKARKPCGKACGELAKQAGRPKETTQKSDDTGGHQGRHFVRTKHPPVAFARRDALNPKIGQKKTREKRPCSEREG